MTATLKTYRTTPLLTQSFFDSIFDPFFESVTIPTKKVSNTTDTHVSTEDDKYVISVLAPGLEKDDFNITSTEGTLTVGVDKKNTEFGTRAFTKSWTLPDGTTAEDIAARYKQGILRVEIKRTDAATRETVTIKVS